MNGLCTLQMKFKGEEITSLQGRLLEEVRVSIK